MPHTKLFDYFYREDDHFLSYFALFFWIAVRKVGIIASILRSAEPLDMLTSHLFLSLSNVDLLIVQTRFFSRS